MITMRGLVDKPKHLNSILSSILYKNMEQKTKCNHKLTLPLYARDQNKGVWTSTQKLVGQMIYICTKCGATLDRGFVERDDVLCEGDENENK